MTLVEIAAAAATLVSVWLTARGDIRCWPWGIVSVLLYGYVFIAGRLYSSAALQLLFYLPMQLYGWHIWLRGGPARNDDLPVATLPLFKRLVWAGSVIPLAWLLGALMGRAGAQLSYADAGVSALSVVAQILLSHKYIENWVLWITIDLVYAFYLLPAQRLYPSMALYLTLLALACLGLWRWLRVLREQRRPSAAEGNR